MCGVWYVVCGGVVGGVWWGKFIFEDTVPLSTGQTGTSPSTPSLLTSASLGLTLRQSSPAPAQTRWTSSVWIQWEGTNHYYYDDDDDDDDDEGTRSQHSGPTAQPPCSVASPMSPLLMAAAPGSTEQAGPISCFNGSCE